MPSCQPPALQRTLRSVSVPCRRQDWWRVHRRHDGQPHKWERHHRLGATATYSGWQNHRIRPGLGAHWAEMYQDQNTRNSNNNFTPIGTGSLADLVDVAGPALHPPHSRQVRYAIICRTDGNLSPDWT